MEHKTTKSASHKIGAVIATVFLTCVAVCLIAVMIAATLKFIDLLF